ncbi:Transmembrane 9 superfamily member [Fasciola gigantica]|uniref:Transmembrane 9 superfamily member n=1 Tax=Fasciola gigantica TaxID=46835 RepID=A0A504YDJ9_FASGI|nr:Transmembrane 9 superfamily member [Fasciola gigantica]
MMLSCRFFVISLFWLQICSGFYLPGIAPANYCAEKSENAAKKCKTELLVYVNKLTSRRTFISLDYSAFDFCKIVKSDPPVENLGQVVFGERLDSSDYRVSNLSFCCRCLLNPSAPASEIFSVHSSEWNRCDW